MSFDWKRFNVPHPLVSRTLSGLVVVVVVLVAAAWFVETRLTDRQIAGTQRVLQSLHAESGVLEERWRNGELPAVMLRAEQEHIEDEQKQQQAQLADLQKSSTNG